MDTASAETKPKPDISDSLSPKLVEAPAEKPDSLTTSGSVNTSDSLAPKHLPDSALPTQDSIPQPILESSSATTGVLLKPRPQNFPTQVRVLLSQTEGLVSLYSLGEVDISNAKSNGSFVPLQRLRGKFAVRRNGEEMEIQQGTNKNSGPVPNRLLIKSTNPYNLIEVNGLVYRGDIILQPGSKGSSSLQVVNQLPIEDYLRGVLPYEMGNVNRDALESLKAMAVAARTYTYQRLSKSSTNPFDLYSDVQDQVYKGVKSEYLLSDRAIRETRNMVLLFQGNLTLCYYHSTCGGTTANLNDVWRGEKIPYLISLPDKDESGRPYCAPSGYSHWVESWDLSQLTSIIRKNLKSANAQKVPDFHRVEDLQIISYAACGRVRELRVETDKGSFSIWGDKVRWLLRPKGTDKILPSAFFSIKVSGNKVTLEGKGFGHGIGLCQMGAMGRARAGQNYLQILQAYYSGTDIVEYR